VLSSTAIGFAEGGGGRLHLAATRGGELKEEGSGRGQLVGGGSEEVAVVSQDRRGERNREALGWRLL
jgi:hypothetical protein